MHLPPRCCKIGLVIYMKVAVIHGPNLNFTGIREPHVYGTQAFEELCATIKAATPQDVHLTQFQSNHEGGIIDFIQQCHHEGFGGIVLNAGAYTHYSHAIADAVAGVAVPTIEVHLSNTASREGFRHTSVIARHCIGTIAGFGAHSYILAINHLIYLGGVQK